MENRPARTARGLSIATFVLAILSLIFSALVCFTLVSTFDFVVEEMQKQDVDPVAVFQEILNDTPELREALEEAGGEIELAFNDEISTADYELLLETVEVGLIVLGVIYLAAIISSLIASIYGMKRAKDPKRYGAAIVWAILGAVFSGAIALLFGGALLFRLTTMILCILMAVYEGKARKFADAASSQAYPGYQQSYPNAGYAGVPQAFSPQPYGYQPQQQGYAGAPMQDGYMQNGYGQNSYGQPAYGQNSYQQPYHQGTLPPFPQVQAQPQAQPQVPAQTVVQDPYEPSTQPAKPSFEPEQHPVGYYTYPEDVSGNPAGSDNASGSEGSVK